MKRRWTTPVLAAYLVLYSAAIALACRVVIDEDRFQQRPERVQAIVHKSFRVAATVRDQVADVVVKPVFHNPNPYVVEGTYFLSIPAGAQVRDFKMKVGDKVMEAELLDSTKARQIYESIVRRQRDPALLELVGTQMLKCSIFPIQPRSDIEVTVGYTTLLANEGGLLSLDVPFSNQFGGNYPVPDISVAVDIESKAGLKNLYSPTHAVDIRRKDDHKAILSWEARNYDVRKSFKVFWQVNADEVGCSMLTYRTGAEDGYFLMLAQPKVQVEGAKVLPKDVVFVFDRSGSMAGEKMAQGKEALSFFINSLNDGDRFNIVDFSSEASALSEGLVAATKEERARALKYVEAMKAAGGTNISEALEKGLALLGDDPARIPMVLFATDGLPTVGEQRMEKIVETAQAKSGRARVFVFGVGNDVNTQFLDRLAEQCRGARDYVAPEEKIEAKVGALFEKVSNPVLADVAVELGGVKVKDVYPKRMPDLFKGQQVVVFGRYEGGGAAGLKLSGSAGGEKKEFRYDVHLAAADPKNDFIPRLWAARKVAFLVDSIRMGGAASKEVIDEIIALGKKHGIVTPYTSFLITEEDGAPGEMGLRAEEKLRRLADDAAKSGGRHGAPAAPAARGASGDLKGDRDAENAEGAERGLSGATKSEGGGRQAKMVGTKTFILREGVWTDLTYDPAMKDKIVKVEFMSEEYLKLAAADADLAKWLGAGERVLVVLADKVLEVVVTAK